MLFQKSRKIELIYQVFVKSFVAIILFYLTISSIIKTYYCDGNVKVYRLEDSWIKNIFCIFAVIAMFTLVCYLKSHSKTLKLITSSKFKYLKIITFLLLGLVSVSWVLYSQIGSITSDDASICYLDAILIRRGEYYPLQPGGYLYMATNNLGFTWFIRFLMALFEQNVVKALYVINAISLPIFYFFLARIAWSDKYNMNKDLYISCVYLLGIIFSPLIYLCLRFYGNMLGLCLATGAIYFELSYFRSYHISDLVLSIAFILFSVVLKMNYYIFAMAMIICALVKVDYFISRKMKVNILFSYILILIAIIVFTSSIICLFTEIITGQSLNDAGYSLFSHIAMGLQDTGPINKPGWWNSYNFDTFAQSGYSNSAQKQMAIESIKESLKSFFSNPQKLISFLDRKINSQWNCPEFEMDYYIVPRFISCHSPNDNSILIEKWTTYQQSEFLNVFHSIILFGALTFVLLFLKSCDDSTVLLLTFLGGFLFHIAWEAQAIYSLSFFPLLIPFALIGYESLAQLFVI